MRLSRIKFKGYKRLLDSGCNVDADLIALVGPNEAGKTTVLEALSWLSNGGPLDSRKVNRTVASDLSDPIVTAVFVVEPGDLKALVGLDIANEPRRIQYSRYRDGETSITFEPKLIRKPSLAEDVLELIKTAELTDRMKGIPEAVSLEKVVDLAETGREWSEQDGRAVEALADWLELPISGDSGDDSISEPAPADDVAAAEALMEWHSQMTQPGPGVVAGRALEERIPRFLLFSEPDRKLSFEHDLKRYTTRQNNRTQHRPSEDVQSPDGGLVNLLRLAGTSIRDFYDLVLEGMPERTETHVRRVNRILQEEISPYWGQRDLQVRIDVSDTSLRVFIDEGDDTARFTDRSDGLRMFIALISFLAQHKNDPAPILLIDEADTHLHYNAQADLINFLSEIPSRTIYTTHSPGCLPLDLGTGIRVVKPNEETPTSVLSNNFWENDQGGLSPLLFAMGAGAAAFTSLRAAVFAEGASDMMLLPALIREATDERKLGYQVLPGLANIQPGDLGDTDYAAVRVAYLLDGDKGGDDHEEHLIKAEVPRDRILRLPPGKAIEDLVDPEIYLAEINALLIEEGRVEQVTFEQIKSDIDGGVAIVKAVERVLGGNRKTPSKVAVAGRLLRREDSIPLTQQAREILSAHHATLRRILNLGS